MVEVINKIFYKVLFLKFSSLLQFRSKKIFLNSEFKLLTNKIKYDFKKFIKGHYQIGHKPLLEVELFDDEQNNGEWLYICRES